MRPTEYEWATPEGRAKLDADVRGALMDTLRSRNDIADALRVHPDDERGRDAITASLARGIRDGWADPDGQRAGRRYKLPERSRRGRAVAK